MKSMTGFGSALCSTKAGVDIRTDIASYNKKQLDIRIALPNGLAAYEMDVRKYIAENISRGAVTVKIEIQPGASSPPSFFEINRQLASAYMKSAENLRRKLDLNGEIDINEILKLPGVIQEVHAEELVSGDDLMRGIKAALKKLLAMRSREGAAMKKDIKTRIKTVASLVDKIEPLSVEIPRLQKERLSANLNNAGLQVTPEDERVLKEIVIYSDRCDVSEEITRIRSHFGQFRELLERNAPVGRTMEFMIQELQREINTLGTKAAHSTISPLVIEFKTELEKIREQVQNVE